MIIDATGPKTSVPGATVGALREEAMRIEGVEDVAFPYKGSPQFAVVKANPDAEASRILGELGEDTRLVAMVDDDIDINDPREVL